MPSTENYSQRLSRLSEAFSQADHIIIGAGSGLSTAAGIDYAGADFRREFQPWVDRYGFTDLYSSSFYPFESDEERWAYWAKHIWFSRFRTGATQLYCDLLRLVAGKSHFVITTNVDGQFELAGFDPARLFATQGDYRFFQPLSGSPQTLLDNHDWVMRVLPQIRNCRIPADLIPHMPDGQPVAMNLRVDDTFVEDDHWHRQSQRYADFVRHAAQSRLLLLEFGIGYNTPSIIRFPFERMASTFPSATLVRFNSHDPAPDIPRLPRFIPFTEEIASVVADLLSAPATS